MTDNPFDGLDLSPEKAPARAMAAQADAPAAPPASDNPFAQLDLSPEKEPSTSSAGGAFARAAGMSAVPTAGGLAGAEAGAETGAAIGALIPGLGETGIGEIGGGIVGGLIGGFAGGAAGEKAQDYGISKLPDSWRDPLETQLAEDQKEHSTASFLGGLVPQIVTMKPGAWTGKGVGDTALERIMSNPLTSHLFGAGVMGGMELGQESVNGDVDWQKVAVSTGVGLFFNEANSLGKTIGHPGASAVRRAFGREPEPAPAPAAPPPAAPPAVPDVEPNRESPDVGDFSGLYDATHPPAKVDEQPGALGADAPTLFMLGDTKVAGPGIDESVFLGSHQQEPQSAMTAQEAARMEEAVLHPPPPPALDMAVRRMEPELTAQYDALTEQRDALAKIGDEGDPRLAEVNAQIRELDPQIAAAHRRAAEATGAPVVETPPPAAPTAAGAPPPGERTREQQREWVRQDMERRLIAAGRSPYVAQEEAAIVADRYDTISHIMGGALGSTEEVYLNEHPQVLGPNDKPIAPGKPPPSEKAKRAREAPTSKANPVAVGEPMVVKVDDRPVKVKATKVSPITGVATEFETAAGEKIPAAEVESAHRIPEPEPKPEPKPEPPPAATAEDFTPAQGFKASEWWHKELTPAGRRQISKEIGLNPKREAVKWHYLTLEEQGKLVKEFERRAEAAPEATEKTPSEQEPAAEPAAESPRETVTDRKGKVWTKIGENRSGNPVWEDDRGIRSYVEDGVRVTETVGLSPDGGVSSRRVPGDEWDVAKPEEPSDLDRLIELQADLRRKLADQGTVTDARTEEQLRKVRDLIAEERKAEAARAETTTAEPVSQNPVEPAILEGEPGQEESRGPAQLDDRSGSSLEGVLPEPVSGAQEGGQVEAGAAGSGGADASRDGGPAELGALGARGLGNDAGELSVPASGESAGGGVGERVGEALAGGEPTEEQAARNESRDPVTDPSGGRVAEAQPSDFVISDADNVGGSAEEGGFKAKARFRDNLAAIETLKRLAVSGERPTREDQAVIAKWIGWGGLPQAFRRSDGTFSKGWAKEGERLEALLTPEELAAAAASTRNAHYTSPEIVKAMWAAMKRMGFDGGRVLEPSMGIGNFFGLMPKELRAASGLHGVELDAITGGLAKVLYPEARIAAPMSFVDYDVPEGYFDAVVGNPPFARDTLYDPKRPDLSKFSIHNYFFAKSVDGLRPGAVMSMVVTNRFLDGFKDAARQYIAERAELIGAIRLPNSAFSKNANTEVTTDIIFLRKKMPGQADLKGHAWTDVVDHTDKNGRTVPLNQYFADHPDMMLGEFGAFGTMYSDGDPALIAREGQDTQALLNAAVEKLPLGVVEGDKAPVAQEQIPITADLSNVRVGAMFKQDGRIFVREEDSLGERRASPVELEGTKFERASGMIDLRDAFADVRRLQLDPNASDAQIEAARKTLNETYDKFVKQHGFVNSDANARVFGDDPSWPQIAALEDKYDRGLSKEVAKKTGEKPREPSAVKAAVFTKRTQKPYAPVDKVATAKDALVTSLAEKGRVDLDHMAKIYGKDPEVIVHELGPLIFNDPVRGYIDADAYLSGNVKKKLAEAREAAAKNPAYEPNVRALEAVQPADLNPADIFVRPGAHWLPRETMADFARHITGTNRITATFNPESNKWKFDFRDRPGQDVQTRWGTDGKRVEDLLEHVANQQDAVVRDNLTDPPIVDEKRTAAANEKIKALNREFQRWVFEDDARRDTLSRIYNDLMNTDVKRDFDGSHLTFPGKVDDAIISLRPHQKNAIWRALQSATTLFDHTVGTGKTFTIIGTAMEMRRIGQARKPAVVVPNHLVTQWAKDFIKLYPGANILAATKRDFEAANRKQLFARIAAGDYDSVIIPHSSFGKIEVDPKAQHAYIEAQVADLVTSMNAIKAAEGAKSQNIKDIQKRIDALRERQKKLLATGRKDNSLYFHELGIDALFLDEAHEFKNLAYSTSMQRVAGLGAKEGSQKASDLHLKIQQVLNATGGRNVVFATGTPISNTMAEMYTMMRYLDGKGLAERGMSHFDAWARTFGEVVNDWEISPAGKYKLNSRFAKFTNMPELMQRYSSFADVITNDDMKAMLAARGERMPLPAVKGGKPQNTVVDRSPVQAKYIGVPHVDDYGNEIYPQGSLIWRAENLPKGKPQKGDDNMLKIMSDARKAALDMRLIDPEHGDYSGSKVNVAARNIKKIYDQWDADKGTQLVFCDLSTPKGAVAKEKAALDELRAKAEAGDEDAQERLDAMSPDDISALESSFSVYDDLKQKLIDQGIPAKEIAFIHDAGTDLQKDTLFGKVRSGQVRVLMGSTAKMGAGTNVQERLVALHHMDAPWRPSDLEQREGRIIRQGNALYERAAREGDPDKFKVEIHRYATRETLDSRMWQTIEGKANFIEQVRKGGAARSVEDVGGEAMNAAEMKAASSGNPKIFEEMQLRKKVKELSIEEENHRREQYRIKESMRNGDSSLRYYEARLENVRADSKRTVPEEFAMKIDGKTISDRKEAGEAILKAAKDMQATGKNGRVLGHYGDWQINLVRDSDRSTAIQTEDGWRREVEPQYKLQIEGATTYDTSLFTLTDSPGGLVQRLNGPIKIATDLETAQNLVKEQKATNAKLGDQIREWDKKAELQKAQDAHDKILGELKGPGLKLPPGFTSSQPDAKGPWHIMDPEGNIVGSGVSEKDAMRAFFEANAQKAMERRAAEPKPEPEPAPQLAQAAAPPEPAPSRETYDELRKERDEAAEHLSVEQERHAQGHITDDELAEAQAKVNDLEKQIDQEFDRINGQRLLLQKANASIRVTPGKRSIIRLMETANASSFLHEEAHDWLEQMKRHSAHPAAPESLKADWRTIRQWAGIGDDGKISTKAHEKFARGFEQYLRLGVAPSPRLAGAFARFKLWLTSLYRTVKGLGTPINEDIRGVFDRMLSTDPQRTVISPEAARAGNLASIHEADAAEAKPGPEAEAAAERVNAERLRSLSEPPPEIAHEIAASLEKVQQVKAERDAEGGRGGGEPGAESAGEAASGAAGRGDVGAGGAGSESQPDGGGVGEQSGAQRDGGGEPLAEGASGAAGRPEQRPDDAANARLGLAPRGHELIDTADERLVDKAGNIRLDNLNVPEDVAEVIRETARRNDDFIGERRGVITDGQMMDLAEALGMDYDKLSKRKIGEAFNAEQAWAARGLLRQSAMDVAAKAKAAANGTDEDLVALALAEDRHRMIQAQIAGITSEAGRTLRAFHAMKKMPGADKVEEIGRILKQLSGNTPDQMKKKAKLIAALDSPEKVSNFVDKFSRPRFTDMILEYWINGLISGPATHVTYSIGNTILAAVKTGETGLAGVIGGLRGRKPGERVYAGEAGQMLRGAARAIPTGIRAAAESFKAGVTTALPGEKGFNAPFQPDSGLSPAPSLAEGASYHDAAAAAFGILRGMRDGMISGAALLAAGGVKGEPVFGARYSPLGAIPDFTFRGVAVAPVGTMARVPSRFIAAIHSFFRSVNYSMEKSALAYRAGASEGLTGDALAQRVGQLWQSPTEDIMRASTHEATEATLMGQGGELTQALSKVTNARVFGIKLFKFIDPFVHISSNIIEQSIVQRTPLGILSPEIRADLLGKNGAVAADKAAARMLAGTATAMLFGGLAASGYVSGSGPSDPRQAAIWRLAGNQAHSVRIGDIWYDVHRLGPMGMLMGIAADLYDVVHTASQGDMLAAGATLQHAITQNILDESFMKGPADLIKAVEDPGRYGEAYLRNWASSFVPYSVGMAQMARAADPYSRQARTVMDAIRAKIPGESETLFPRRDIWGEPMPNPEALGAKGVTAIYEARMSTDPVNLAMLSLGIAPAAVERKVRGVQLTDAQYDDYQRIAGRMTKMRLDVVVNSPAFSSWPANVKHDVLTEVIKQCRETARGMMLMKNPQILADAYALKRKAHGLEPAK